MKQETYTILQARSGVSLSGLKNKKYLLPDTPCDECKLKDYCIKEGIACRDFKLYMQSGKVINKDRIPSKKIREDIFPKEKKVLTTLTKPENGREIVKLQTESDYIQKIKMSSLVALDLYFNGEIDIEKAKMALLTYGAMLRAQGSLKPPMDNN